MLEARSALAGQTSFAGNGVSLKEEPGFILTQVAGADASLRKAIGKLPTKVGKAIESDGRLILRIAPHQFWAIGGEALAPQDGCYFTPLSSGRCRFSLSGTKARELLSSLSPVDFDEAHFKPGDFLMTGIHHTPVLIHCTGEDDFHIYVLRTFARNVWEVLEDAAASPWLA